MALTDRSSRYVSKHDKDRFFLLDLIFPEKLYGVFYFLINCLVGFFLVAVGLFLVGSLLSWSGHDPSPNHATDSPVRNIFGAFGANISDSMIQAFGIASFFLPLFFMRWGWIHIKLGFVWRPLPKFFSVAFFIPLCAAFTSALPPSPFGAYWPLPSAGNGGFVGDLLKGLVKNLGHDRLGTVFFTAHGDVITPIFFGVLALPFFLFAMGSCRKGRTSPEEEGLEEEEWEEEYAEADDQEEEDVSGSMPEDKDLASGKRKHLFFGAIWFCCKAIVFLLFWIVKRIVGLFRIQPASDPDASMLYRFPDGRIEPFFPSAGFSKSGSLEETEEEASGDKAEGSPVRQKTDVLQGADRLSLRRKKAGQGSRVSGKKEVPCQLPSISLLAVPKTELSGKNRMTRVSLQKNAEKLERVLEDFGVKGSIVNVRPGPVVTLYELEPAPGIKSSRVIGLADDISRSMSAVSARVAVVSGRNAIGIELPNAVREPVFLRDILASRDFNNSKARLPLALGKVIGGEPIIADLARMPHLLIAGTTGSGKSVGINTMILSLLYRLTPKQCRLIMIDPKMLELSIYDGIPHLLTPVVTDPKKAIVALKWTVREMEERYRKMSKMGVRNIDGFNERVQAALEKGDTITRTVQTGFDPDTNDPVYETEDIDMDQMPYLVVIVDEMADLMMVAGKDIEGAIQRLAQMARAAGIHLITATQRPSVDVITGTIKANFPTRISFQVTSKIDSRTILGEQGAEQLLGQGDMLYMAGGGRISRVHGPFVSDTDVEKVVQYLKSQGEPEYLDAVFEEEEADLPETGSESEGGEHDELYDRAVRIVLQDRKASTSYIQRRLSLGYNRAATLIERMEQEGLISPANHAGRREILVGQDA